MATRSCVAAGNTMCRPSTGLLRIAVREARQGGDPVSGRLLVSFQPNAPSQVQLLSDRGHRAYSSSNLNDRDAALLVRDGEDDGPRRCALRLERDRGFADSPLEG